MPRTHNEEQNIMNNNVRANDNRNEKRRAIYF